MMIPSCAGGLKVLFAALTIVAFAAAPPPALAEEPDNETCLMCHDGMDRLGMHKLGSLGGKPEKALACVSCHSGGETHVDDPSRENIGNPATMTTGAVETVCATCHQPHLELDNVGYDPHRQLDLTCSSCHRVHGEQDGLLIDDQAEFCGSCHVSAANEFQRRSNHPVLDGIVTCVSCHDFVGRTPPGYAHGQAAVCADCHAEQTGPFLFEHEAGSSFSIEGSGCIACHRPHGSPNERLLNQPGNAMCRQCHGLPPGHLTAHGGAYAALDCMDCHSAVHGSNDNRSLLDSRLGILLGDGPDGCFCHNVGD